MEEVTGLDREIEHLSGAMDRINKYILYNPETYNSKIECIKHFRRHLKDLLKKTDEVILAAKRTGEKN